MAMNRIQFQAGLSMAECFERYGTEPLCTAAPERARWPDGFRSPRCGGAAHCILHRGARKLFQCNACRHQASLIAGTVSQGTKLALTVWFLAIYLISQAKTGLSALALKRHLGVGYPTASLIHHKVMQAMAAREAHYVLAGQVQVDDAYLGGERSGGKAGRGSENKIPFVAAISLSDDGRPLRAKLSPVPGFNPRMAALSIAGALGGMLVPAALYLLLQSGQPGATGWGTVMATDTAFVVLAVDASGIHATITGVILGLMTPARRWVNDERLYAILDEVVAHPAGDHGSGDTKDRATLQVAEIAAREDLSPVEWLEFALHPWVGFVIMPLFAFGNAGLPLSLSDLGNSVTVAVFVGFALGKPIGVFTFSWLAVRSGIALRPADLDWRLLAGGALLAGIGFTMALFVANLAFSSSLIDSAKLGIFLASVVSAVAGFALLTWLPTRSRHPPLARS